METVHCIKRVIEIGKETINYINYLPLTSTEITIIIILTILPIEYVTPTQKLFPPFLSFNDRLECVQLLVLQDYDLNTVNGDHMTPLDIARKGVAKNVENYLGQMTPLVLSKLRREKALTDKKDAQADKKARGEGDKNETKNNNKSKNMQKPVVVTTPQKSVITADTSTPQKPVVSTAAVATAAVAVTTAHVAAVTTEVEEDLDMHVIVGKGASSAGRWSIYSPPPSPSLPPSTPPFCSPVHTLILILLYITSHIRYFVLIHTHFDHSHQSLTSTPTIPLFAPCIQHAHIY